MANEARVFAEGAAGCVVRQFTIADGTAISKGALLIQSGNRTGITHAATGTTRPLGFVVEGKEANDGKTEIGCQRTGIVEVAVDGAVTTGDRVYASAVTINRVQTINVGLSTYQDHNRYIGHALENIADGARGKISVELG